MDTYKNNSGLSPFTKQQQNVTNIVGHSAWKDDNMILLVH